MEWTSLSKGPQGVCSCFSFPRSRRAAVLVCLWQEQKAKVAALNGICGRGEFLGATAHAFRYSWDGSPSFCPLHCGGTSGAKCHQQVGGAPLAEVIRDLEVPPSLPCPLFTSLPIWTDYQAKNAAASCWVGSLFPFLADFHLKTHKLFRTTSRKQ